MLYPSLALRVLVVDDNKDAADALQTLAGLWGHDARAAYSGAEALDVARRFRPHLVLLDIGMPDVDGWRVALQLRESPETAAATLLAVTGYATREARDLSRKAGFDAHLTKPTNPLELKAVFDRLTDALPLG